MIVIITGASRGIGKAIAKKFSTPNNIIILTAKSEEKLIATKKELAASHESTIFHSFVADLSNKNEVIQLAKNCLSIGVPDIIINNAGTYTPGNCYNENEGALESMMNLNLYAAYHLTRALLPKMIEQNSGHVFNICSIASLKAYEGGGSYSISKFALNGFSQNLRHELKSTGIKVTAVFPGAVHTESWGDFDNSNQRIMEADDIAIMIYAATQVSKQAVVEEIVIRPQLGDL